jgi:phycocyanobilin lyase subunit beta
MTMDAAPKLIQAVEQADSPAKLLAAVRILAEAQVESGIPVLIKVLGYNNPGAAVAAVEGLVSMGAIAVPALLEKIDGYNYGARAWAIRALARIGDPRALETLAIAAREDFSLSVRRAAAKGLGSIRWALLSVEARSEAQAKALDILLAVSGDPEWVVRYASVSGLQAIATDLASPEAMDAAHPIWHHLHQIAQNDAEPAVRARAVWAIQQLMAKL